MPYARTYYFYGCLILCSELIREDPCYLPELSTSERGDASHINQQHYTERDRADQRDLPPLLGRLRSSVQRDEPEGG